MRALLLILLASMCHASANPNCAFEAKVHKISAEELILGITLTPKDHWHTYWSNPGDSGLALSIELENAGLKVVAEDFPTPIRFEAMGVVGYGYEKAATFIYHLSGEIPEELNGDASWLVCDANACLPANESFSLKVTPAGAELPEWLTQARSTQPTEMATQNVQTSQAAGSKEITYSFNAAEDITEWLVLPYEENFTEGTFGNTIKKSGERYTLGFKVIGKEPETPSFLITDGRKAHKITLNTFAEETEAPAENVEKKTTED